MAADPDAARRLELQGLLGALVSDVRQWAEWAEWTGAEALPVSDRPAPRPPSPPRRAPQRQAQSARPRAPQAPAPPPPQPPSQARPGESLDDIRRDLGECTRCGLHTGRKNIVFGVGNPNADLVIVGEAPGRNEDLTGEPFVGRAGALLNRMLEAIGLRREDVYICNVIKCRPPKNRDPLAPEIASCSPFMHRQLRSIAPKVIMTVGRFAGQNIIGVERSMGELRRETASVGGVPVVATYHPAYLLRTPTAKRLAWQDMRRVRELLR